MQVTFKKDGETAAALVALSDMKEGQGAILERLELPDEVALRLMELGFLPGHEVQVGKSAPGGDPRVYRVDGAQIALRRETTRHIMVR